MWNEASPQQAAGYQTEGHCRGDTTVSPPSSLCKVTSQQAPRNLLIECNFRDAKQYWGLEDFMTVNQTPVYNSANLAMFMVNLSHALIRPLQPHWPGMSVNDLKAWFRSRQYVVETLKLLPEMPEPIFIDQAIAQ